MPSVRKADATSMKGRTVSQEQEQIICSSQCDMRFTR